MDNKSTDFVNVSLRIRPVLSQDSTTSSCLQVISKQPPVLIVLDRSQTYHFDNVFTDEIDQQTVYDETVKPLVEHVKRGYSCTVFAYGQTGTGKTYTMGTNTQLKDEKDGLIPKALKQFFASNENCDAEMEISISFIEIYNEKVFDLLQNCKPPLIVKGFKVQGFSQEKVMNYYEAKLFLEKGNKKRHTAETKQNSNSSRSHAVFTIYCNVKHKDHQTSAKLNLVDLAGCESVKKTGSQGSTFQEGVNINKGLLCIGQVMTALCTNSSFIPYRQSIITTILQDSLNKKNYVSLIACVKSNPEDCNETVQTLEFAHRVKKMKNKPEVSEAILQYKKDHPALFPPLKIYNTPFKRSATSLQTPYSTKRAKNEPLKAVHESSRNCTIESPKSLVSMNISSIYHNVDVTQQNLSPVIKKYMNAMESSLMDKLQTVIKDTLKSRTRSSILSTEANENKENTPRMPWNMLQNEVSRLVKNEIVQLTTKTIRAASSPIDDHPELSKLRKTLKYDSPVLEENVEKEDVQDSVSNSKESFNKSSEFKIPKLTVAQFKKQRLKHTSSISPIEYEAQRPRQSLRLSLKRNEINISSSEESDYISETTHLQTSTNTDSNNISNKKVIPDTVNKYDDKRRYSVRLEAKRNRMQSTIIDTSRREMEITDNQKQRKKQSSRKNSIVNATLYLNECNGHTNNKRRPQIKRKHLNSTTDSDDSFSSIYKKTYTTPNPKVIKLHVKDTFIGRKVMKCDIRNDSPATAHTKHVLHVLNDGNLNQLGKLHSIGPKTAQQVLLFRELKGPLEQISDLSKMPGWHGRKFEKFIEQNFLKRELV